MRTIIILILLLLCSPASAANFNWSTSCVTQPSGGKHCHTVIVVQPPRRRKVTHYPTRPTPYTGTRTTYRPPAVTYSSSYIPQRFVEPVTLLNPYFK